MANVVGAHNVNPVECFGMVVLELPDDKVLVYALNPDDPTSDYVPQFPTLQYPISAQTRQ